MRDWTGKTAVVTGAGSGIGAAMALRFARAGMNLVLADIDANGAGTVESQIIEGGGQAIVVETNVGDQGAVEDLADRAWARFGAVHVVCNNAGVVPAGRYRPVWEYPMEDWQWSFGVNAMGVIHGVRAFVPRMIAEDVDGHVVTTASVAGLISGAGSPVYSAAKHVAVRVTEALYASLADIDSKIGVTLLCPGLVNTKIYQSERARPGALRPAAGIAEETPELQAIADNLFSSAISPESVADQLLDAMNERQLYLLTSESFDKEIEARAKAILARENPAFESLMRLSMADADVGDHQ